MAGKIGERFVEDMVDRGWRELGGILYEGSNIAQPMFPRRGEVGQVKEADAPELGENKPTFEELHPTDISRDDRGIDDRDRGIERE
jgi:hypothetical protein